MAWTLTFSLRRMSTAILSPRTRQITYDRIARYLGCPTPGGVGNELLLREVSIAFFDYSLSIGLPQLGSVELRVCSSGG